jgi:hypothetical protein
MTRQRRRANQLNMREIIVRPRLPGQLDVDQW